MALELIEETLAPPAEDPDPYLTSVAVDEAGRVLGYVTWGHQPGSEDAYDLYWIAVDPTLHGRGVGRLLVGLVEDAVRGRGGGTVIIETASKASYENTRAFYLRTGYVERERVADYYAPGDHKVVYVKRV